MLLPDIVLAYLLVFACLSFCRLQILRNCKVARVLPKIADTAKNDRSAVLRARYLIFICILFLLCLQKQQTWK
jgi:CLIP-associating protein 1/2